MFEIEELTPHGWRHELEVEDSRQAFGSHENDVTRNFTHTEFGP